MSAKLYALSVSHPSHAARAMLELKRIGGEREFQPLPRRFFRWGLATQPDLRTWAARDAAVSAQAAAATALPADLKSGPCTHR